MTKHQHVTPEKFRKALEPALRQYFFKEYFEHAHRYTELKLLEIVGGHAWGLQLLQPGDLVTLYHLFKTLERHSQHNGNDEHALSLAYMAKAVKQAATDPKANFGLVEGHFIEKNADMDRIHRIVQTDDIGIATFRYDNLVPQGSSKHAARHAQEPTETKPKKAAVKKKEIISPYKRFLANWRKLSEFCDREDIRLMEHLGKTPDELFNDQEGFKERMAQARQVARWVMVADEVEPFLEVLEEAHAAPREMPSKRRR